MKLWSPSAAAGVAYTTPAATAPKSASFMISPHLECQLSAIVHLIGQLIDRSPNEQGCGSVGSLIGEFDQFLAAIQSRPEFYSGAGEQRSAKNHRIHG